jgi:hypothetical protein
LTLPEHEIVDCGAFGEVIFFFILPKNLPGDFFYSLNAPLHPLGWVWQLTLINLQNSTK